MCTCRQFLDGKRLFSIKWLCEGLNILYLQHQVDEYLIEYVYSVID